MQSCGKSHASYTAATTPARNPVTTSLEASFAAVLRNTLLHYALGNTLHLCVWNYSS